MSNTSLGMAIKGSKLRMQQVANNKNLTSYFSYLLGEKKPVTFISPLASENFKEYQLKELKDYERKNCDKYFEEIKWEIEGHKWYNHQPLWDGIAISKGGDRLYIIEAKSHIKETNTRCSAKEDDEDGSRGAIKEILRSVLGKEYIRVNNFSSNFKFADEKIVDIWMDKYYQLANRIVFLKILQEQCKSKELKLVKKGNPVKEVKLVLLNFVNDGSMPGKEVTRQQWDAHYRSVFDEMFHSSCSCFGDIKLVYIDVDNGVGDKRHCSIAKIDDVFNDIVLKDISKLYRSSILNAGGVTDDWQWRTEYIAAKILGHGYDKLSAIPNIDRGTSYSNKRKFVPIQQHPIREVDIAKHIFLNGDIRGIGKLLDYQVHLSDGKDAGAIDLLAYDKEKDILKILELKDFDSNESLLRCVIEVETYRRFVADQRFLDGTLYAKKMANDFHISVNAKVVSCPVIFAHSNNRVFREYQELIDGERPNLRKLLSLWKQEIIVIESGGNRNIEGKKAQNLEEYRVVETFNTFDGVIKY